MKMKYINNKLQLDEYQPIPGFFDLRNFKLSKREFIFAWDIQLFLRSYEDQREYHKKHNARQWEDAKHVSAELQMFLFSRLKHGCELS